tara:strand:+ start:9229 stop:10086 length:858 start_codon:yes stop_codon:yes gene_type:complete
MTYKVGIELEIQNVTVNEVRESVRAAGAYYDGHSGYHGQGMATGWKSERDGSLGTSATETQKGGIEVISRPLKGAAGIREMKRLCTQLIRRGATVDRRCGTHITFGLDENARFNRMSVAKKEEVKETIVSTYLYFQNVFDAISPNNRQVNSHTGTQTNHYCMPADFRGRTSSVNMVKYVMYGVVEFRQPGFTINGKKIEQWVKILNAVVSAATNENHVSRTMDLTSQPVTIESMCNYLNIRNTTEDWMVERVTEMATKYTGGRGNRLNVLARTIAGEDGSTSRWV